MPDRLRTRPLIWLVDDSATNRTITEHSLGDNYEFAHFHDGAQVVETLVSGARQPDVLLLDWVMPGLSGDEVCRFLRAHPGTRDLPIIVVTASRVETGDVVRGLEVGANDYVARPFAAEELRARVEAVLRTKELQKAALRERNRLTTVNVLGRKLFEARTAEAILQELASTLTEATVDGCSILLLPGELPQISVARHRADTSGAKLAEISTVADPAVFAFDSSDQAARELPPAYQSYVSQFGLRGLAVMPLPLRAPIHGVVTVTRDGRSKPLDEEDLSLIETCIEYASLALQNVIRLEAERTALAQLHAVLSHAPIGIVVTDRNAVPTLVNPRARQLLPGIERAHSLHALAELGTWTTLEGEPVPRSQWETIPNDAEPRSLVIVLKQDDVPPRTFALTTVAQMRGDEVVGSVTTFDDVTAEREIAAERERVAHFQEQMIAIVSHDLRSPLSAILMGAYAITQGAGDPNRIAERIANSGNRMATIVDQLLDVTRARLGGGIPIVRREAVLDTVVRAVLDELALAHPGKTFQLVASEASRGQWDPDRLAQVVSNLVGNAIQYGREGEPIRLALSSTPTSAVIEVSNALRGEPMSKERLQSMFDPFKRGGTRHNSKGLGLGLYIVSEIVRAHGGTISAATADDTITFRVELPLS